jgi:hypothetical protein
MSIDKNTRLIDLTVADLMVIIKECMTGSMPVYETLNNEDEIGGYVIAETITGYSRQTLYLLNSAGELPYIGYLAGVSGFQKRC